MATKAKKAAAARPPAPAEPKQAEKPAPAAGLERRHWGCRHFEVLSTQRIPGRIIRRRELGVSPACLPVLNVTRGTLPMAWPPTPGRGPTRPETRAAFLLRFACSW